MVNIPDNMRPKKPAKGWSDYEIEKPSDEIRLADATSKYLMKIRAKFFAGKWIDMRDFVKLKINDTITFSTDEILNGAFQHKIRIRPEIMKIMKRDF